MINSSTKIFLILLISSLIANTSYSNIETKILFKINNEIITNIDLENEKKFLIFLNPNLKNLSNKQVNIIATDSIKNRKIKEIELNHYLELNKDELSKSYIDNFISISNFQSREDLIRQLKTIDLDYKYFEKNFIIDNVWREFIFQKFKPQVKIDIENLKNQITTRDKEIEEINLSEILFEVKRNENFEELKNKIYDEIEKSGFEAAASMYSISDSKNFGGNLGWVKSNQISKQINSQIKKVEDITTPIKTNSGFLILKINERRKIKEEIDFDEELKKLIELETQNELNKLGYIYFNKIKRRTYINEK